MKKIIFLLLLLPHVLFSMEENNKVGDNQPRFSFDSTLRQRATSMARKVKRGPSYEESMLSTSLPKDNNNNDDSTEEIDDILTVLTTNKKHTLLALKLQKIYLAKQRKIGRLEENSDRYQQILQTKEELLDEYDEQMTILVDQFEQYAASMTKKELDQDTSKSGVFEMELTDQLNQDKEEIREDEEADQQYKKHADLNNKHADWKESLRSMKAKNKKMKDDAKQIQQND